MHSRLIKVIFPSCFLRRRTPKNPDFPMFPEAFFLGQLLSRWMYETPKKSSFGENPRAAADVSFLKKTCLF